MAVIVNLSVIAAKFGQLGWVGLSPSEVADFLAEQSIAPIQLVSYLNALIASPDSLDDQTITGCTPANANKITGALKAKRVVG